MNQPKIYPVCYNHVSVKDASEACNKNSNTSTETSTRENMRLFIRELFVSGNSINDIDNILCDIVHTEVVAQSLSLTLEGLT